MRAFIVRPFGTKSGIDFDAVEKTLIGPALEQLDIGGRTTAEIMGPGNIREDMFQLLLTADLVIADITLHNANVYYELGIRHALRDRVTVLLRGAAAGEGGPKSDAVPFDLLTDRYLSYPFPLTDPKTSVDALVDTIRAGLASTERDSPVFKLLPKLTSPSPDDFLAVPMGFEEDAAKAGARIAERKDKSEITLMSGDLALLAHEAEFFPWSGAGLRLIGGKQFDGGYHESAKLTWEQVRLRNPLDLEANVKLSTTYQKLGDLPASNAAAARALSHAELGRKDRAEIHALHGRNLKSLWLASVREATADDRKAVALGSPLLAEAIDAYAEGFRAELSHYYAGINDLALRTIQYDLAKRLPDVWGAHFSDDQEAALELGKAQEEIQKLQSGVALALESAEQYDEAGNAVWRAFTAADLKCLCTKNPARVGPAYRKAIEKFRTTHPFALSSARDQLLLLQLLDVLPDNVIAGLAAFPPAAADAPGPSVDRRRILLFAGHRIDDEGRKTPRFPRTAEAQEAARRAIHGKIERVRQSRGVAFGLAGGASGGDILFHEACAAHAVPTWLYLALPAARYKDQSVRGAGDDWVARFDKLEAALAPRLRFMSELKSEGKPDELPRWLQSRKDYGVWQRNNLWMLYGALAFGPDRVTLIVLWDGESQGDGPGGTADIVETARALGADVEVINSKTLFGLG